MEDQTIDRQSQISYSRLEPKLEKLFTQSAITSLGNWQAFRTRLKRNFPQLFRLYFQLYGTQHDFYLGVSAKPDSIGAKTFGYFFELEFF